MEDQGKIAYPYASAAFNQAREEKDTEGWSSVLRALAAVMRDPQVKGLVASPSVDRSELASFMIDVVGAAAGASLKDTARNFIRVLLDNGRLGAATEIAGAYEQARARAEQRSNVRVTSAFDLSEKEVKALAKSLGKRLGTEVQMNVDVDPELIGGVVIRAGDTVIDGSVRGRLQQLSRAVA